MVDGNVYENGVKNISCPPQAIDSLWLVECLACVRLALLLEWNAHVNRFEAVVFRNGDTFCGLHFFKLTWQLPIIYTIITWSSQTFYFENLWFICVSCFFRIVSNMLEPLIACVVLGFENLPESKRKIGINIKVDQRSSKYTEGDEYQ